MLALAGGPMQRRAQWVSYRPAPSDLSTLIVKKSSHDDKLFSGAEKSLIFGDLAPH